jgi:hypothetical protein
VIPTRWCDCGWCGRSERSPMLNPGSGSERAAG